jgi:AAA domain
MRFTGADALSSFCFDAPLWAPQGASPQCPHHKDDPSNLAPTIIDCEAWWREPASIPRRQFLYGRHYARRNIGATIGAGGRAKTTQGGYEAVSMAVGHDLASGQVLASGPLRVWMLNGEEDQDELDRRLAAVCQHYGITKANLGGRLFAQSVRDKPLRIASMRKNMPILNEGIVKFMADFIDRNKIDVFMIDPLVSFHAVPESDNPSMDLVIKEGFGAIANRTNSAGEVFHHPGKPKPGQSETVVEDSRGASSVIWAVRAARVLNFMSPEEAAKLGISEDDRRLHIRLVNGKANMGPLGSATWIKLAIESLPSGDEVAVAGPWSPPDPFDGRTPADMQRARDLAAEGTYRHDSRSPKWLGYALANHFDFKVAYGADNEPKDFAKMQAILKTWLKNKVLEIEERKDSDHKLRKYFKPGPFKDGDTSASDD